MSSKCDTFKDPSAVGAVISLALAAGIGLSYVPQHLKIIQRKSAEGLSSLFLLLGTTSGISAFANLILLSSISIDCCSKGLSVFECFTGQLGLIQVGTQAIFAFLIVVFCVYCTKDSLVQDKVQYYTIYKIYQFTLFYIATHAILIIYTLRYNKGILYSLANAFGLLSTLLASFQYLPQIYTIYKLKHPGSLSISMMCMQTPGGFVWSLSLYLSPGSIWSSWFPYLTAATLQGVLLLMCAYYIKTYPAKVLEEQEDINTARQNIASQRTPLLGQADQA